MSTYADRNSPMVINETRRARLEAENRSMEQAPVEPHPTIAARVGRLVQDYLSPPLFGPGSMAGGSAVEDAAVERWRAKLGEDAATLWGEVVGRDPEAVRLVELVQYRLGFIPGSMGAFKANDEIRAKYRRGLPEFFA